MNQHTKSKMTPDDGALETASAYADNCDCEIQYDEPAAGLRQGILFCPLHEAAADLLTALELIVTDAENLLDGGDMARRRLFDSVAKSRALIERVKA